MASKSCFEASSPALAFFELNPTNATKYYWAQVDSGGIGSRKWPRDFVGFTGCMSLTVDTGTFAADFVWSGHLLPLVSDRVLAILDSNSLAGFSTYRARLTNKGVEIPGYCGLAISGRGGPNHPKAYAGGHIKGTTIRKVEGLYPTQWDGSDLFTLDDVPGAILATEKVRCLFKKEKVTNCRFTPAEEFSIGRDI